LWIVQFVLVAGVALAQERPPVVLVPLDSAAAVAVPAQPAPPALTRQDCLRLGFSDVEYRPGVDVNGQPVVPADLPNAAANLAAMPPAYVIDLKRSLGAVAPGAPAALAGSDVLVGRAAVDPLTGRVALNGQVLGTPADHPLARECAAVFRAGVR
jgi:hypothetical protein